jgi:hypothetical protein
MTFADTGGRFFDTGFVSLNDMSLVELEGRLDRRGRPVEVWISAYNRTGARIYQKKYRIFYSR